MTDPDDYGLASKTKECLVHWSDLLKTKKIHSQIATHEGHLNGYSHGGGGFCY